MTAGISTRAFGTLPDGREVSEYRLDNGNGLVLSALDYGGIVTGLHVPDASGQSCNIVLSLPTLADYQRSRSNFGALLGRFAGRIRNARFTLDGREHQLDANDGVHCLHGGAQGFARQMWQAATMEPDMLGRVVLIMRYLSADGEMGFPGEMEIYARYTLGRNMSWRVDLEARTTAPTVVNLSLHPYFNLAGAGSGSALDHELTLHASRYSANDADHIPVEHLSVEGTPFDFRTSRRVGDGVDYNHNFLIDAALPGQIKPVARLTDPASGRVLEVSSTEPCVQFYAAHHLNGSLTGPEGQPYGRGAGLCLETQHAPDSPNHAVDADWPSTVLRPDEVYRSSTIYRFNPS